MAILQWRMYARLPVSAAAACVCIAAFSACSFDYNFPAEAADEPDIVMKNLEYIRMEKGVPYLRFRADEARQFEKTHTMEMDEFFFEQFNASQDSDEEPGINIRGTGAFARIQTDSGNVDIRGGVAIDVISEEISIKTPRLSWNNEKRMIKATEDVELTMADGTTVSGRNFSADIRGRSWQFENTVNGVIVEQDSAATAETTAETSEAAAAEQHIVD